MSARPARCSSAAAVLAVVVLALLAMGTAPPAQAASGPGVRAGEANIIAVHSGRCVEAENSAVVAGAAIVQADCAGQAGAVWRLQESAVGSGAVNIVNVNSGRCMEVQGTAVGSPAMQTDCTSQPSASFRMVDRTTHVWLQPLSASPPKCLEVDSGSHASGAPVRLAECSGQSGIGFQQRMPRVGNDPAEAPQGGVERVNVTPGGGQIASGMGTAVNGWRMSADGRYVVFASDVDNLVAGDTNGMYDVFVRDRTTGVTERVSVSSTGAPGNAPSTGPSISADGRYIAFTSKASNLAGDDPNGTYDIFVRDRQTGITELTSRSATGQIGNGASTGPSISADGRYLTFRSAASNLVPGDTNNHNDVFLYDRRAGTIERVSVSTAEAEANHGSSRSTISADGRYVTFDSTATNLIAPADPPATADPYDIFVRDRQAGTTELVSVSNSGREGNGDSYGPTLSADGRYVAFHSYSSDLLPSGVDTNAVSDVFVRDRQTQTTQRISVNHDGSQALMQSVDPYISSDGRHVSFISSANRLVEYDTNTSSDAFVRDRQAGTTVRASVNDNGVQGNNHSTQAVISPDGQFVAFASTAANLVTGDTNTATDLFIRPRPRL
ncbi:RICIN domain-containing protein [Streptomyces jumonjinensis]|uniref:RICIN domain-containing protein n=1 Tax=Streptomyces jumonjinensis TaxID=1945 RepID=UPI0037AE9AF8